MRPAAHHAGVGLAVLLLFSAVFLAVRDTADARATPLQSGEADALWTVNDDHTWFKSHLKNWSKSDDNTTTDYATNATTDDATGTWSKGDDADDDADDDAAAWGQNADDVTAPTDDVPFAANGSQPTNAFAPFEKRIDLREYAAVQEFLKSKGVSDDSDEAAILQWVPSALVVRMWPDRVAGAVGGDALGGFVAFSIIQPAKDTDDSYTAACYLIVMSLTGDVQSVKVFSNGTEAYGAPRIDGMKLMDPDHLILSFNTDPSFELGRAYSYEWRTGLLTTLLNGTIGDSHDVQWQPADAKFGDVAGVWRPTDGGCELYDATTGAVLERYDLHGVLYDINHAQVLTDSDFVILNGRSTDCFTKYNRATLESEWIVGGTDGTLDIIGLDGRHMGATATAFSGQHNLEYFGEGEYMMFDNNFDTTTGKFRNDEPSRLLIVKVDEEAATATLDWELVLADATPIYGDNDRLPSGNLLASSWPSVVSEDAEFQYDVRYFETVRETKEVAWEAFVIGERCASGDGSLGCVRSTGAVPNGWSTYSVERFYTAPLVANVTCATAWGAARATSDSFTTTLMFVTWDNFKQNAVREGAYRIFAAGTSGADDDAGQLLQGGFNFSAHWRPSYVSVDLTSVANATGGFTGMVEVWNRWGDRTSKHVECR